MRESIKKFFCSALIFICVAAMVLPCSAAALASGTQNEAQPLQEYIPDYSNPSSEATVELLPSEFTELLTGGAVSATEKLYIDSMLIGSPFRYSNNIPPRCVQTVYRNNILTVNAYAYSYTAKNGTTVTWLPKDFLLVGDSRTGELKYDAVLEAYTATIDNVPENTVNTIELSYTCHITVKGEEADVYINYAYRYAKKLEAQQKDYKSKLEAYEKYQTYLVEKEAYDKALSAYNDYLDKKAAYEKKYAEYEKYQSDMALYREQLALYNAYLIAKDNYAKELAAYEAAYAEYIKQTNIYTAEQQKYDTYLAERQVVLDRLAMVDNIFVANSEGKRLYATLMGNTVADVVANKDLFVTQGGCDPKLIDTARDSTKVLQTTLTEYKNKATLAEKLAYYQAHYTAIKENFASLYGALYALVDIENKDTKESAARVRTVLKQYGKFERYIEFLAQLFVISTGLDDEVTRDDDSWCFQGKYNEELDAIEFHYIKTELEEIQRPVDKNNADPAGLVCPAELKKPTAPSEFTISKPTPPVEIKSPIEPDVVKEPIAPQEVAKPEELVVVETTEKPIAPSFTAMEKDLQAEYTSGKLKERAAKEKVLSFSTKLSKPVTLVNKCQIEFYDYDGKTLLYSAELDKGADITYPSQEPKRPDTQSHSYTFAGWKDEHGEFVTDLGVADELHTVFYASYRATVKQYEVKWVIGDVTVTEKYDYGTVPSFGKTPTKDADAQYSYTFKGWHTEGSNGSSNTLAPVTGNITYEALFESALRYYTVTWKWGENGKNTVSEQVAYGTVPRCKLDISRPEDGKFLYTFKSWDKELSAVIGDVIYTAQYEAKPIMSASGEGKEITVEFVGDSCKAELPVGGAQVDTLLSLAAQKDKNIELIGADKTAVLFLNEAMISDLLDAGCTNISIATKVKAGQRILVSFTDKDGKELKLSFPVTLRYLSATESTKAYSVAENGAISLLLSSFDADVLTVKLTEGGELLFRNEYTVEVSPLENGMLSADSLIAYEGQTVKLSSAFADKYQLSFLKVVGAISGKEYAVAADSSFVMPNEPVKISGALELKKFKVQFVVDGVVFFEAEYHLGEMPTLPDNPQKADSGNTVYTFNGWSPTVTAVNADVVYTAVFKESVKSELGLYVPTDISNRAYILYLEIAAVVLVLSAAIATPIMLKKRKKRKQRKQQISAKDETEEEE